MYSIAILTLAASVLAVPLNQARQGSPLSALEPIIAPVDAATAPLTGPLNPVLSPVDAITGPIVSKIIKRQISSLNALTPVVGAADVAAMPVTGPLTPVLSSVDTITGPIVASIDSEGGGALGNIRRQSALVAVPVLVQSFVKALVSVLAAAKVDVNAVVANAQLSNTNLLSEIANGNTISARAVTSIPVATSPIVATIADVTALLSALIQAALKADVNVFAVLGNLNIDYSSILSNLLNNNTINVARRGLVDVSAIVKAVVSLVLSVAGYVAADVNASVANLNINYSTIASDILNGNNLNILSGSAL